jgi:serine/threonine protein kinase
MPVSVERFLKRLSESGILSLEDVLGVQSKIPEDRRNRDSQRLAQVLVRQNKLTFFQATALCQERPFGLSIGNYVLQERIGAGGMGSVFKAEHRLMKRSVAVKVLPPSALKDPEVVQRFRREVEAVAKLTHANIVAAHDADEFKGVHFLVMEYVEGVDLARLVRDQGPLPLETALGYVLQAARGLEHAHKRGIIHRDVKPANLLLDGAGTIKILDLGLARFQDSANPAAATAEASSLTKFGSIMGTIDFMSPEQALDTRQADHTSDIYSLGATLYTLLANKPLYGGDTVLARILAHREAPLPSLRDVNVEIPVPLDMIFQRMIAKKREDRYPSMTDVIADLVNWHNPSFTSSSAGGEQRIPQNVISAIFDE